jgi:helix-turn-helix, Psq domain
MSILTQESCIIIAIEAIQTSRKRMSRQAAAKLYDVRETTLRDQIAGRPTR